MIDRLFVQQSGMSSPLFVIHVLVFPTSTFLLKRGIAQQCSQQEKQDDTQFRCLGKKSVVSKGYGSHQTKVCSDKSWIQMKNVRIKHKATNEYALEYTCPKTSNLQSLLPLR
jgi:hypothetical protein